MNSVTNTKDVVKENYHLMLGDCLERMKEIPDGSVDLILTDPPYNISRDSCFLSGKNPAKKGDVFLIKHDFGEWDKKPLDLNILFNEFNRVLKRGGTLLIFYDIWKLQDLKTAAENFKFKQPRVCCWVKNNPVPLNSDKNYLSNACEYFVTFVKSGKGVFNSKYDNGLYKYPICHGKERTEHPTQKPLMLISELVLKHSNKNDVILDMFMGSGSTGVAALNTNRKFIGFEMDEGYFNIAVERINNEVN